MERLSELKNMQRTVRVLSILALAIPAILIIIFVILMLPLGPQPVHFLPVGVAFFTFVILQIICNRKRRFFEHSFHSLITADVVLRLFDEPKMRTADSDRLAHSPRLDAADAANPRVSGADIGHFNGHGFLFDMMERGNSVEIGFAFDALYSGVQFIYTQVNNCDVSESTDSDGNTSTTVTDYFCGYVISYPCKCDGEIQLLRRKRSRKLKPVNKYLGLQMQGVRQLAIGDSSLEEELLCGATDEAAAGSLKLLTRLYSILLRDGKRVDLFICKETLHIFVEQKHGERRKISAFRSIENQETDLYRDFNSLKTLIKTISKEIEYAGQ